MQPHRHREKGPLRHLEWVIVAFTSAYAVLGAVFLLYGWWALAALAWFDATAWPVIAGLIAWALTQQREEPEQ